MGKCRMAAALTHLATRDTRHPVFSVRIKSLLHNVVPSPSISHWGWFVLILITKPFLSPESDTRKRKIVIVISTHSRLISKNYSGVIRNKVDQNYTAAKLGWIKREEGQKQVCLQEL